MKKTSLLGLVAVSLLTLAGCGDPIVGSWEGSDKSCGSHRNEFTIDGSSDDLTGDGSFWFGTNGGGCVKCSGDITGKQKREGQYTFSIKFGGGNGCSELPDGDGDCELKHDDTELQCDIQVGGGSFSESYDLVE